MPRLNMNGKVRHYAYTPEGKAQYERDKAAQKMSPGMQPRDGGNGLGTDGKEGFKSAKKRKAEKLKTKSRTRSKY